MNNDTNTGLVYHYLRQVNEVNGGDDVFVRCVCVSVCAQRTGQSDQLKMGVKC